MLHSVMTRGKLAPLEVLFLRGPELPPHQEAALREMVDGLGGRISFIEVPEERTAGLRTTEEMFPTEIWYRIFLPELVPDVDRVLYLDCDLIAVDSLEPLWATALGDHYLAAVTNVFMKEHVARLTKLRLPDGATYFNSGVLLMNLDLMRRERATEALRSFALANAERIDWPEQDALNVVLGDRRLPLHPRWNVMNSVMFFPWAAEVLGERALAEARRNPAIRHFEGPLWNKPWHYLADPEMRALYREHRRQTPWPRVRLEGATPLNRIRRALRRTGVRAAVRP
jgi:lipopolysaccharide biosynthesis glycosyltransferase